MTEQEGERLARFLARAGVASRRRAEDLMAAGRVQVNGVTVTTQGTRIDPSSDIVTVDGSPVAAAARFVYVMLHKPTGYITTASDPRGRPTVLALLSDELLRLRLYPIGRLDIDTSGLLLLTNDGDFAQHIAHPRYAQEKVYHALVRGSPSEETLEQVRRGVEFREDDGRAYRSAPARVQRLRREGGNCWLSLAIHEGRKRQVRRMMASVGHPVLELRRVSIGPVSLADLPAGKWRYLTDEEVKALL